MRSVEGGVTTFRQCPGPEELRLEIWGLIWDIFKELPLFRPGSQTIKTFTTVDSWRVLLQTQKITYLLGGRFTPFLKFVQGFEGIKNSICVCLKMERCYFYIIQKISKVWSRGEKSPVLKCSWLQATSWSLSGTGGPQKVRP